MISIAPHEAYRLWAPTYADETAISMLENDLALAGREWRMRIGLGTGGGDSLRALPILKPR